MQKMVIDKNLLFFYKKSIYLYTMKTNIKMEICNKNIKSVNFKNKLTNQLKLIKSRNQKTSKNFLKKIIIGKKI